MTEPHVTQKVWNPGFVPDIRKFLGLSMPQDALGAVLRHILHRTPTTYEKLQTLIDRIEFVGHLSVVREEAGRQKYEFSGCEIRGIDWDIDSLRMYLALTCVDILSTNFQPFDDWVLANCGDFDVSVDIQKYLLGKSAEYREKFQLSSNFIKAFSLASDGLRTSIGSGLAVRRGEEKSSDIERIATYLYKIRNKYTHEGRRFFSQPIPYVRRQVIGPRDEDELEIKAGFDVVDAVLSVAKEQAVRTLEKYAEQSAAQRTGSNCASADR